MLMSCCQPSVEMCRTRHPAAAFRQTFVRQGFAVVPFDAGGRQVSGKAKRFKMFKGRGYLHPPTPENISYDGHP